MLKLLTPTRRADGPKETGSGLTEQRLHQRSEAVKGPDQYNTPRIGKAVEPPLPVVIVNGLKAEKLTK